MKRTTNDTHKKRILTEINYVSQTQLSGFYASVTLPLKSLVTSDIGKLRPRDKGTVDEIPNYHDLRGGTDPASRAIVQNNFSRDWNIKG